MYEEIVESSRLCAMGYNGACDGCIFCGKSNDKDGDCYQQLHKAAADAIEELVRKEKFHTFLWNVINPNEMEEYIGMYNSKGIPVCGLPEPPKEKI